MAENNSIQGILPSGPPTQSLQVVSDGLVETASLPKIDPGICASSVSTSLGEPNFPELLKSVCLITDNAITDKQIEALAISLWADAGWSAPGELTLHQEATLRGPWELSDLQMQLLRVKDTRIYQLVCPTLRSGTIPAEMRGVDPISDAFSASQPYGLELEALQGIWKIARRLHASIYIPAGVNDSNPGHQVLKPQASPNLLLSIYSSSWINHALMNRLIMQLKQDSDDLHFQLIDEHYSETPDCSILTSEKLAEPPLELQQIISTIPVTQRYYLEREAQAFDAHMAQQQLTVDSPAYSISLEINKYCTVLVEVEPTTFIPPALQWQAATCSSLAHYQIRTIHSYMYTNERAPRALVHEITHANRIVEALTSKIALASEGHVLDEDLFLVGFQS